MTRSVCPSSCLVASVLSSNSGQHNFILGWNIGVLNEVIKIIIRSREGGQDKRAMRLVTKLIWTLVYINVIRKICR